MIILYLSWPAGILMLGKIMDGVDTGYLHPPVIQYCLIQHYLLIGDESKANFVVHGITIFMHISKWASRRHM